MSFTHLDEGTDEARWSDSAAWAGLPSIELSGIRRVVVLSAHPDDETLGAGGLIATAQERGIPVRLIVATDGEASHPGSPTHSPDRLRALRRAELGEALGILAPDAEIEFLGLPDAQLSARTEELREHLTAALGEGAGVLLVAPWRGDGHGDHEAAGAVAHAVAARSGARLLEYPIWMWHWADPDDQAVPWHDLARLALGARAHLAKRTALAAHRSQVEPLSDAPGDEALLSEGFQRHFDREVEVFVVSEQRRTEAADSLPGAFFDEFYAGDPDPWGFDTRWYEERKRAITVAALPRARYRSALEVGCSTGALTAELAPRCTRLLGVDIAAAPLLRARRRLRGTAGVELAQLATPGQWPQGEFDLIVLSEVGYYWSPADLEAALGHVLDTLTADGTVVACHWRHPVPEYPLGGDAVHAAIAREPGLARTLRHEEEDFLLEVFTRPPARSVARETGLLP